MVRVLIIIDEAVTRDSIAGIDMARARGESPCFVPDADEANGNAAADGIAEWNLREPSPPSFSFLSGRDGDPGRKQANERRDALRAPL